MLALEIKVREPNESVDSLRKRGVMPAVFYGPKEGATAISIDALKFDRVWKEAGETTVIQLKGIGDVKEILIHDVQFHPVTSVPLHADFYVERDTGDRIKLHVMNQDFMTCSFIRSPVSLSTPISTCLRKVRK